MKQIVDGVIWLAGLYNPSVARQFCASTQRFFDFITGKINDSYNEVGVDVISYELYRKGFLRKNPNDASRVHIKKS
jgi:hypothetical protein